MLTREAFNIGSLFLAFSFLILSGIAVAQDQSMPKTSPAPSILLFGDFDGCGAPEVESQLYDFRYGRITKILSGSTLAFRQATVNGNRKPRSFVVRRVGIDPQANSSRIVGFLKKNVLNKPVTVWADARHETDFDLAATVTVSGGRPNIGELNRYLLENGLAKYRDFDSANLVQYFWPYRLEKAEQQAKEAKLGIWSKSEADIPNRLP